MKYPIPVRESGKWVVDLRPEFPSWHYVLGPDSLPEGEAIHRAWARLTELRAKRAVTPTAQLSFVPPGSAPATFAGALDAWEPLKLAETKEESKSYVRNYARRARAALGGVRLEQFTDGGGQARLVAYLEDMRARGEAARTIRNTLNTIRQVLIFCTDDERRWIPFVPRFPRAPKNSRGPVYDWIGEPEFRAIRARIYAGLRPGQLEGILVYEGIDCEPRLYVQRRRLYLSWLFYTGVRTADADNWTADDVGLDSNVYVRHGTKTGVSLEQFEMPDPLVGDLRAYLRFVGREHFQRAEPLGGGPWKTVAKILQRAAKALDVSGVNPRILRRSFARKMFTLGYTIKQVAERMGHADLRMLNEIYVRTPRPAGQARSLWHVTVKDSPGPTPAPPRKVLAFGRGGGGTENEEGNE